MIRVTRCIETGRHRPPCVHSVHVCEADTQTKRQRVYLATKRGLDPTICGRPSVYLIEGLPHCPNHAGQVALSFLCQP